MFYQGYSDVTDVAPLSSLTVQSHDSHYQSSGQPRSKTLLCSPQSAFFFLYHLFMSSCFGYLLSKTKFYSILFCFFLDIFLILIFYQGKNVYNFVLLWFYTSVSDQMDDIHIKITSFSIKLLCELKREKAKCVFSSCTFARCA